ncbi:MAG TPA: primase alpha helix C-terminal domain-containing protein, partial [Thermoanaerobaculia bacterium]
MVELGYELEKGGKKVAAPKEGFAEGGRNTGLFRLARRLHASRTLSDEAIRAAIQAENARCQPPLDDGEVDQLLASAAGYPTDERPRMYLDPGAIARNVPLAEELLNTVEYQQGVFQRGTSPVVVRLAVSEEEVRNGRYGARLPAGAAVLRRAEDEHVTFALHNQAAVLRHDGDKVVPADITSRFAKIVLKNAHFRPLLRVVRTPTLRHDGSLLEEPGYDRASALIYAPNAEYPAVPSTPTREDAGVALARLLHPFRAFPFVSDVDKAVIAAELLTVLGRHLFPQAPCFIHRAAEAASGKTILADAVAVIVTGTAAANVAAGVLDDKDELRKLLTTWTLNGTPLGLFDNMNRGWVLNVSELNRFLTAETYGDRLLGGNTELLAPVVTTVVITGNQIDVKGDATRRSLISDLDARCERPEQRSFDFDLLKECRQDRPALVAAALTLLRAYVVADFPRVAGCERPFGSFEQWERWVRFPLVWAGAADPVLALEKTQAGDEERVTLGELLGRLHEAFASARFTAKAAIETSKGDDELAAALLGVARGKTGEISPERLGRYLKANVGRVTGGYRLAAAPDTDTKTAGYRVEPFDREGGGGEKNRPDSNNLANQRVGKGGAGAENRSNLNDLGGSNEAYGGLRGVTGSFLAQIYTGTEPSIQKSGGNPPYPPVSPRKAPQQNPNQLETGKLSVSYRLI